MKKYLEIIDLGIEAIIAEMVRFDNGENRGFGFRFGFGFGYGWHGVVCGCVVTCKISKEREKMGLWRVMGREMERSLLQQEKWASEGEDMSINFKIENNGKKKYSFVSIKMIWYLFLILILWFNLISFHL